MASKSLSDALLPMSVRSDTRVREQEIMRIGVRIDGTDIAGSAHNARIEVLKWVENRSAGRLPPEAWNTQSFEYFSGGRNSVGVRIESDTSDLWAVRVDDPDRNTPGRIWTHEVVIGHTNSEAPLFSYRQLVSTREINLNFEPHVPGFIQQIENVCGISSPEGALQSSPLQIKEHWQVEDLVNLLLNKNRQLPLFLLAVPEGSEHPLVDGMSLYRATLGLAHVAVISAPHTWTLSEKVGRQRSVYSGAARVYMPGFALDDSPYRHRLELADQLGTPQGILWCRRWMRELAALDSMRRLPLGREILTFAAIRSAQSKAIQDQLYNEGAPDEAKLKAAQQIIDALEGQIIGLQSDLAYFDAEHKKEEERAEIAEEQLRAARFRVQQIVDNTMLRGELEDHLAPYPTEWADVADWCDTQLIGRLVLTPKARRLTRLPLFDDVALVVSSIVWLANECRDRRMGKGEGTLRDVPIQDGVRNSLCGGDEYTTSWEGRSYSVDWHIKNGGNTRDPTRCLRIYYFWDATSNQIVIDELPAHRHTSAS